MVCGDGGSVDMVDEVGLQDVWCGLTGLWVTTSAVN